MDNNNTRTRAFDTVKNSSGDKRRKTVIAIFVVIALILASFATLIIGKLINQLPLNPGVSSNTDLTYVPLSAEDIKKGNLLIVNDTYKYELPSDLRNMVNVKAYIENDSNSSLVKINGKYIYSLTSDDITLTQSTLDALNLMLMDYCNTIDIKNADSFSASNIEIAWGGYSEETRNEYATDISNMGKDYYDHALGSTVVIKKNSDHSRINEAKFKSEFRWIYENAHKYGFILRYPDTCASHTGQNSNTRIHYRYVGIEHATYIYENNICLEEYIELLRTKHNSVNSPLTVTVGDKSYDVYYVKYNGNPTSVPVPKDAKYTISGDNMNGFIVSVEK